jgi:hypothetical protein
MLFSSFSINAMSLTEIHISIIDISDSEKVQIVIEYRDCVERLNVARDRMEDANSLSIAIDQIIKFRDGTNTCKS